MTTGEVVAAAVLSVAVIWIWSQVAGFVLTAAAAAWRAFWRTRIESRWPTVEDILAREAMAPPNHVNCRCIPYSVVPGAGRPWRRLQLVERLALDVGEDDPVFCSWPAGRQTITLPTRGGDPMTLFRTNECILDDGTGRLAVVYRQQPENTNERKES